MQHQVPNAHGTLTLQFGSITGFIVGGPYRAAPDAGYLRVKLAREIKAPCEISLPIEDFSTPDTVLAVQALKGVLAAMSQNRSVYVGCMGGMGRTGLFLALLVKVAEDYALLHGRASLLHGHPGPVEYVRAHYYGHAVETRGQERFVADFDTAEVVAYAAVLQPLPEATPFGVLVLEAVWDFTAAAFGLAARALRRARALLPTR